MVAAVEGHTKIVRTLVIHGAELDARDEVNKRILPSRILRLIL